MRKFKFNNHWFHLNIILLLIGLLWTIPTTTSAAPTTPSMGDDPAHARPNRQTKAILAASCDMLPTRQSGNGMAGYQPPEKPILAHEPGYAAPIPQPEKVTLRSNDSNSRGGTIEGTLYDDPFRGNYSFVSLDRISLAFVDNDGIYMETYSASDVAEGVEGLNDSIPSLPDTFEQVEDDLPQFAVLNEGFEIATGDLNGDDIDEQLIAYNNAVEVPLQIYSLIDEANLLKSAPVAHQLNGQTYLFAHGFDDALWVGLDDGTPVEWQRCGGTLVGSPAVAAIDGSTVQVVVVGSDGLLYERTLGTGGNTDFTALTTQPALSAEGGPAVVNVNGTLHYFARLIDNTVVHSIDGGAWSTLGGYLGDDPAALADESGITLLVRNFDDTLWYRRYAATVWSDWQSVEESVLASAVSPLDTGNATFSLYARDANDGLIQIDYNGSQFGTWQSVAVVTDTVGSRPGVAQDGTIYSTHVLDAVLQRSDGSSDWATVAVVAPERVEIDTGLVPDNVFETVTLDTGHFLGDGREQIVVATTIDVLNSKTISIKLFGVEGGLQPVELASITLALSIGEFAFDVDTGDFDGDGTDEIGLIYIQGTTTARVLILDYDQNSLSVVDGLTLNVPSGDEQMEYVSLVAGYFDGTQYQDLAYAFGTEKADSTGGSTTVGVLDVNDSSFAMNTNNSFNFVSSDNDPDNAQLHVELAAGDLIGLQDGTRRDQLVLLSSRGSNNEQAFMTVYAVDDNGDIATIDSDASVVFNSHNQPYQIAIGDLDRDTVDEIALVAWNRSDSDDDQTKTLSTWELAIDGNGYRLEMVGSRTFGDADFGFSDLLSLEVGDVTGDGLRAGAPQYRLQQNVAQLHLILNAPPTHVDTIGDDEIEVATGGNGTAEARYQSTDTEREEITTTSTRSHANNLGGSFTAGNPSGSHFSTFIDTTWNDEWTEELQQIDEQSITTAITALQEDRLIYSAVSYQVWEYPIFTDDSDEPSSYFAVVFPVPESPAINVDLGRSCDSYYLPQHETGNLWSYPTLGDTSQFTGYSSENDLFDIGNITVGDGLTEWTFSMSDVDAELHSTDTRFGLEAGAELQIGGDTVEATVGLPFTNFTVKRVLPSVKGSYSHVYATSELSTTLVTTVGEVEIGSAYNGIDVGTGFTLGSYLYIADGGYYVLDHTVSIPSNQGVWDRYDSADPAFRRPWAFDALCGADEIDFSPEIVADPLYASPGETVTISATVHNYSNVQANSVTVRFYQGDPDNGGVQIGSDQQIINLNRLSGGQTVSVEWVAEGTGEQRIYAVIDPDNALAEVHDEVTNVNNNKAYGLVYLGAADFVDQSLSQEYYELAFDDTSATRRSDMFTYGAYVALEAVSETLLFELLESEVNEAAPDGFSLVGHPVDLIAYANGGTLNVDFTPEAGTEPSVLRFTLPSGTGDVTVRRLQGSAWVEIACGDRSADLVGNNVITPICETGTYAVFTAGVPTAVTLTRTQTQTDVSSLIVVTIALLTTIVLVQRKRVTRGAQVSDDVQ